MKRESEDLAEGSSFKSIPSISVLTAMKKSNFAPLAKDVCTDVTQGALEKCAKKELLDLLCPLTSANKRKLTR